MTTALFDTPAPTRRRVTPTARLVLSADAPIDQWLRERRKGIGSSDIPPIMGLPECEKTPLHVYYNKRGELPEDDDAGEPALWGHLHEDTIAREWARRNKSAIRRVGLVQQIDAPHRMCTLDRRVTVCPLDRDRTEACALEVKNRNAFTAGKWRKGCPDDVLAQTLWQHKVTGFDHIHVAALIGSSDFRQFTVFGREHAQLIEDITTIADRLWHEHIIVGRPPEPSGNPESLVDLFDELNPDRGGVQRFDRDLDVHDALDAYLEAGAEEKDAQSRKAMAKALLVQALGDAEIGVIDDKAAFTYELQSRTHVDTARLLNEFPAAYAACVSDRNSRRLNVTNQYRRTWGRTR